MKQISVTATHNSFVNPIPATRNLTVRKSVYDLTAPEVDALRKAFAALQAISVSDNRGYQYVAGLHGLPNFFCPHGTVLFLIWHRPYVLFGTGPMCSCSSKCFRRPTLASAGHQLFL